MFIAEQLTAACQTEFLAKRIIFSFILVVVVLLIVLELNYLQGILQAVFQICTSYLIFQVVSSVLLSSLLCGRINPFRKSVLITGCDSGFGFSIAKRLNKAGFQVFAACLSPFEGNGKELKDLPNLHCLKMDVTEPDDINLAYEFVLEHLDQNELWAVINNAGIGNVSPIEVLTMSSIEEVVNVNLLGMIRVTKVFLPLLRKSNGRVINVASITGRRVMPGFVPYCVSKHAVIAFSDGLRLEVQKFGVSVVTIEPWAYRTRLSDASSLSKLQEKQWSRASDSLKDAYNYGYLKSTKQNTEDLLSWIINPNITDVIDVMEDAVNHKYPPYFYRPGKWYLNTLLNLLNILPKPVSEYILYQFVFKSYAPKRA